MVGNQPPRLNVARWLPRSAANGPGERFVLWLQGCGLACPDCWNPDTWSFAPRVVLSVAEIMALIADCPGIEGVTLTGGEPFAQAQLLAPLARQIRAMGLSLVVFTGHELHELRSQAAQDLLAEVDVLVTGRFVLAERDLGLPLRGSRNQRVHFLTVRYGPHDLESSPQAEVYIDVEGGVHVTGFLPEELLPLHEASVLQLAAPRLSGSRSPGACSYPASSAEEPRIDGVLHRKRGLGS